MLRPIANLCNLSKIMEKIVSEMIISDMKESMDPALYGNLKNLQRNCKREVNAVLCMFVDWKQAYSWPTLGSATPWE